MMQLLTTFPNSISVNYFDIPKSYIPHMVVISKEINKKIEESVENEARDAVSDKTQRRDGIMTVEELEAYSNRRRLLEGS